MQKRQYQRFDFYDYETTGVHSGYDQVVQFAGVSTDENLNIIKGSEANVIVRPRPDVVPSPMAFLTTNIDINVLKQHGITEFELARYVQARFMSNKGTCISGYNTINFDDELTRTLMFRNMKSSYDHEWKNNNGRADIFRLIQLTYAFFPNLIEFPEIDGKTTLKLEHLSKANGIIHENAHDALSDVYATIELAKMVKDRRETLYDHFLNLSDKRNAANLLFDREPLFHVTSFFDRSYHSTSLVQPIVVDGQNANKFHCIDLRFDPSDVMSMSAEDIRKYLFTKREDLPEGSPKLPVASIQTNKQPLLSPFKGTMNSELQQRFQLDLDRVNKHKEILMSDPGFANRLQQAMMQEPMVAKDAFVSLYSGGFIDNNDAFERAKMHYVDQSSDGEMFRLENSDVYDVASTMKDAKRQSELLLRAKWNNFYERILASGEFSALELSEWSKYLEERLYKGMGDEKALTVSQFKQDIKEARLNNALTAEQDEILVALESHVKELEDLVVSLKEINQILEKDGEALENSNFEKINANNSGGLEPTIAR